MKKTPTKHDRSPVKCVQTGAVYPSASAAAAAIKATRGAMSNMLDGRIPSLRGLTFKRISQKAFESAVPLPKPRKAKK